MLINTPKFKLKEIVIVKIKDIDSNNKDDFLYIQAEIIDAISFFKKDKENGFWFYGLHVNDGRMREELNNCAGYIREENIICKL